MKTLALLGSTGSIGKNVLNVVRAFPDRFRNLLPCCDAADKLRIKTVAGSKR